jgi:hypothetical protein
MSSPTEQPQDKKSQEEPPATIADALVPWFLMALALLAAAGAVIRVVGRGDVSLVNRLNETTLLYLGVSGGLLLLNKVKTLSFGSYKIEMLERIKERQVRMEDLLRYMNAKLLPILLPTNERNHLLNLHGGNTRDYRGGAPVQAELRRLVAAKLVERKPGPDGRFKHISDLKDRVHFDLADYVKLSSYGKDWVEFILANEKPEAVPEKSPAAGSGA